MATYLTCIIAPVLLLAQSTPAPSEDIDRFSLPLTEQFAAASLGRPITDSGNERARLRFRDDLHAWPGEFLLDLKSLVNPRAFGVVAVGGGLAAVSHAHWDDDVRSYTLGHERRWGGANNILDIAGHPATHFGVAGALYAGSIVFDDPGTHDFAQSLLSALVITNVSVTALKYSFHTTRPDGKENGFPSGHTASSFAVAATVEEYHGPWAGLGAYAIAGLVGWHRIDDRKHDLSDVIFGAAFGYAIGKSVAHNRLLRKHGIEVIPYAEASGVGVLIFKEW